MQPSPMAETSRLLLPSLRFCILKNRTSLTSDSVLNSQPSTNSLFWSFRLKRSHVDREPVLHIRLEQSFVGFVDFLDRNDFDIGGDVVSAAKVEHLLRFRDAANHRTGETAPPADKVECGDAQRLCGSADKCEIAADAE